MKKKKNGGFNHGQLFPEHNTKQKAIIMKML